MAFFFLLTLYASARAWHHARPYRWQAVAIVSCAAGMACKESMVDGAADRRVVRRCVRIRLAETGARRQVALLRRPLDVMAPAGGPDVVRTAHSLGGVLERLQPVGVPAQSDGHDHAGTSSSRCGRGSLVANYGWPVALTLADVLPYALFVALLLALTTGALMSRPQARIPRRVALHHARADVERRAHRDGSGGGTPHVSSAHRADRSRRRCGITHPRVSGRRRQRVSRSGRGGACRRHRDEKSRVLVRAASWHEPPSSGGRRASLIMCSARNCSGPDSRTKPWSISARPSTARRARVSRSVSSSSSRAKRARRSTSFSASCTNSRCCSKRCRHGSCSARRWRSSSSGRKPSSSTASC